MSAQVISFQAYKDHREAEQQAALMMCLVLPLMLFPMLALMMLWRPQW